MKCNLEAAKIHAENSIRQKNQSLNYRRMTARVDAVAARVQTAVTLGKVSVQTFFSNNIQKIIYSCVSVK